MSQSQEIATESTPTADEVLERVRGLVEGFRSRAAAGDQARAIPRESVDEMLAAGLSRVLLPRRYGGYEMDLSTWFEIILEVSKADASHGWCAGLIVHHPHYISYFPETAQDAVWADGVDFAIAGSIVPYCEVTAVDGGYVVSGRSPFASGVLHSTWTMVGGMAPTESGQPVPSWFLVPPGECQIEDTWFTIGMRGTGSNTIVTDKLFVPEDRVLRWDEIMEGTGQGSASHDNPMYSLPIVSFGPLGFVVTVVGTARGAYEEFRDWITTRTAVDGSRWAERPRAQFTLGEMGARLDAAELLLRRAVEATEDFEKPGLALRARTMRDYGHAAQLCIQVVDEIMTLSGTAAFAESSRLGRAWRDVHFMAAQLGMNAENNYTHWGRLELGLERAPGMALY